MKKSALSGGAYEPFRPVAIGSHCAPIISSEEYSRCETNSARPRTPFHMAEWKYTVSLV